MGRRGLACLFTTLIVEDGNHSLMNDEAIPLRDQYIRQSKDWITVGFGFCSCSSFMGFLCFLCDNVYAMIIVRTAKTITVVLAACFHTSNFQALSGREG